MSVGRGTAIADAVVSELTASGSAWNTPTPQLRSDNTARAWVPVYKAADVVSLKVSVVTHKLSVNRVLENRIPRRQLEYVTSIVFQQQVGAPGGVLDQSQIDALDLLAEQVTDSYEDCHYLGTPLGADTKPAWKVMSVQRAENGDLFEMQILNDHNIWISEIILGVRGII